MAADSSSARANQMLTLRSWAEAVDMLTLADEQQSTFANAMADIRQIRRESLASRIDENSRQETQASLASLASTPSGGAPSSRARELTNDAAAHVRRPCGYPTPTSPRSLTTAQFVVDIDENLICPICADVLHRPVSCQEGLILLAFCWV